MMKQLLAISIALCSSLLIVSVVCFYGLYAASSLDAPVTVIIPPNTHFTEIADELAERNIIRFPLLFKAFLFMGGKSGKIRAGEYIFPARISGVQAGELLVSGKTVIHQLTIPEGLMVSEILEIIRHNEALSGEITLDIKEGELLPETYHFSRNDKRNDMVQRMRNAMHKVLDEAWEGREEGLPLKDKNQAVTLASIIEKETSLASERSHVAAVYINRLHKNMLLQADPTTAYAITQGKYRLNRPLTFADLAVKSPFNTYQSLGLPPSPIANPGKASLLAALHPALSNDLYFVATGNGGHNFADSLEKHNENVRKYRALKKAN